MKKFLKEKGQVWRKVNYKQDQDGRESKGTA